MSGTLYIVATPIGNLGDLTPRAAETFAKADFIAAEDTRVTLKLLNHLGLKKPMVSYYAAQSQRAGRLYSGPHRGRGILRAVQRRGYARRFRPRGGHRAGRTRPGHSRRARARGQRRCHGAVRFPGSRRVGLCSKVFCLPTAVRKKERLAALQNEERTVIFYEAPHKLPTTLQDLEQAFGPVAEPDHLPGADKAARGDPCHHRGGRQRLL